MRFQPNTVFGSLKPIRRAISVGPVRSKIAAKVIMLALYETYRRSASSICRQHTAKRISWIDMLERHDRLRIARERKGIAGPKEAASRYGWSPNTYSSNENGNAPFSFKAAQKYAAAFGVRAEWLYSGAGSMLDEAKPRNDDVQRIPLISWVSAGRLAAQVDQELIEPEDGVFAALSGLPHSRYFATSVRGDSMDRISPEGSILIVDANDTEPRAGRAYIFSIGGEATYKLFQPEPVLRLQPYSTNPRNEPIFPKDLSELAVVGRVVRTFLDLA